MKLRVGIIGCGMITKVRHAPEYAENGNCEIVAFYDKDETRAKALAEEYGAECCTSVDELLALDLDAVSVCVANAQHAEITIRALDAGKHVLCEKPMAVTLDECIAMVEAAERTGKILMIGHNQRYAKAHQKAHELIKEGAIGKVLSFETKFGHGGPEVFYGNSNMYTGRPTARQGIVLPTLSENGYPVMTEFGNQTDSARADEGAAATFNTAL